MAAGIILYCLMLITYLSVQTETFPLSNSIVNGLFGLIELCAIFYFSGSIIDSQNLASVLSSRIGVQRQEYATTTDDGTGVESYPDASVSEDAPIEEDVFPEAPKKRKRVTK